jgi:hypothetical protein
MSLEIDYEDINQGNQTEEEQAANQEAYYWYILQEFVAINKVFGQTKVMQDLKKVREQVNGVTPETEKPRIIIAR